MRIPRAGVVKGEGTLSFCLPLDWHGVEQRWRYAIRFHFVDLESDEKISLFIQREGAEWVVALLDYQATSFDQFDRLSPDKKLSAASVSLKIDSSLAQTVFDAWFDALSSAQIGSPFESTGGPYLYASLYAMDTGYVCAASADIAEAKATGKLLEIGRLLQRLVKEGEGSTGGEIKRQIERVCTTITSG